MFSFLQQLSVILMYPFLAMCISLLLTYMCIRLLPVLGYVDKPGGRHIHTKIVPRGGGIAVIIAFFVVLAFFAISSTPGAEVVARSQLFWRLFWPSVLLGTLGIIDDKFELKSWVKLFVQLIVVLIIWLTGKSDYSIFGWHLPLYASLIFTVLWVILIINAFNLIDGLDGLASGLSVVSASCMAIWFLISKENTNEAIAMLILAGSCLGFLRYNFHPAKIFLGDTGSTFIGLIFAIIGLDSISKAVTATSLLLPLLAIGVPLFDVALAIWRRSVRKLLNPKASGIMDGDQDHLHHRLLRKSKKQTLTAIYMYLFACGFALATIAIILFQDSIPAIGFLVLLLAVIIAIRQFAGVEILDSLTLIKKGLRVPKRGVLINLIHPFVDFSIIFFANFVACYMVTGEISDFVYSLAAAIPMMLLFVGFGIYNVYWLRVSMNGLLRLFIMILIGSGIYCVINYILLYRFTCETYEISHRVFFAGMLIFTLLTLLLISLERLLIHFAEIFWLRVIFLQHKHKLDMQQKECRSVIYGGGLSCRLYIQRLYSAHELWAEEEESIVGIIDDANALQKLEVHGFKVLGKIKDIENIYDKKPFDKLVITLSKISPSVLAKIKSFCDSKKIRLVKISFQESEL